MAIKAKAPGKSQFWASGNEVYFFGNRKRRFNQCLDSVHFFGKPETIAHDRLMKKMDGCINFKSPKLPKIFLEMFSSSSLIRIS